QGPPAFGFHQSKRFTQVLPQNVFNYRVYCDVHESLGDCENVLDDMSVKFFLVTIEIVPAHPSQASAKCLLHVGELLWSDQRRQHCDAIFTQLRYKSLNSWIIRERSGVI